MGTHDPVSRARILAVLAGAVLIIASSSILARAALGEGASAIAIATWRLTLGAVLLAPWVLWRHRPQTRALLRRHGAAVVLASFGLAAHFAAWIASLEHLSVAASTLLLATNPLWVLLISAAWLRERPTAALLAGMVLAGFGIVQLLHDPVPGMASAHSLAGVGLALGGALSFACYLTAARKLRAQIDWAPLLFVLSVAAALCLLTIGWLRGERLWGWSGLGWLAMLAMAAGPHCLGHGAMNWAVRHVPATAVALAALGEPVGAALLAWWLLDEVVTAREGLWFALVLGGIGMALYDGRRGPMRAGSTDRGAGGRI
jgi:drug/metabolite transporter (DMT)-like permease